MVRPGHADDCSACAYAGLPAEDKDVLDASAFTKHSRVEPVIEPQRPKGGKGLAVSLGGLLLMGALSSYGQWGCLGMLVIIAGLVMWYFTMKDWQSEQYEWAMEHEEWKATQTQAWLQQRAKGELWPCPTCGKRSCPNQHSETDTVITRTGRGRYEARSRTDPR